MGKFSSRMVTQARGTVVLLVVVIVALHVILVPSFMNWNSWGRESPASLLACTFDVSKVSKERKKGRNPCID